MRKKVIQQKQKVVQLRELVAQPECLKLLILHTPFNLNIDSLHQCINLVKLDLSKNNLVSIPYLGDLPNLKFMFIHENKLNIDSLISIFQTDVGKETKSLLSRCIVWVTYWGNKNQFNVRHYLANHTSALAIDQYMVVPQQKSQAIFVHKKFVLPFQAITNISDIYHNHKRFNKNATQQEYMDQFWNDMHQFRRKQIQINPIIKVQKVYRGWIYRVKQVRSKLQNEQNYLIMKQFMAEWSRHVKFSRKLKAIFKKKDKQYLLLPIRQMKLQAAKRKIFAYIQAIKKKVLLRKMNLRSQYKFFNVLKSNQQALKSLYSVLNVDKSSYFMVHIDALQQFKQFVIPVAQVMNGGIQIKIQQNKHVCLRYLYETIRKRRQFLRLLQVNQKSIAILQKQTPQNIRPSFNHSVYNVETSLKNVYNKSNLHFSIEQKLRMDSLAKSIQNKKNMDLGQLKKVCGYGNKQLLRDIVRGVYFYNMGFLTNGNVPTKKINILSQFSIKKLTSILKIQKMWRGSHLRRKIREFAKQNYLRNRAATKIQRWFRNLRLNHRKLFMLEMEQFLRSFNNDTFYINLNQYINLVKQNNTNIKYQLGLTFLEQNISIFISKQTKKILLSWNSQTKNEGAYTNSRIGKKLFTQKFIYKIFQNWQFPVPIKYGQQHKYEKCEISHLFHYLTQISIVYRKIGQYLQIKCASKFDSRLRILGLKLLTYSFNRNLNMTILSKDSIHNPQIQNKYKKAIKNVHSIFVSQRSSQFQIKPIHTQVAKTYDINSKFYISYQGNQKPSKYSTFLKVTLFDSQQKQPESDQKYESISVQEKFDVRNYLITQTSQIKLDVNWKSPHIIQREINLQPRMKKDSLKNIKMEKKIKIRNREKSHSDYIEDKEKHNFMLADPHVHQRLTTQPDLITNQRSMGSILIQPQNLHKKTHINKSDTKLLQSRVLMRKKIAINNQQGKINLKNVDAFTKNFINQGNFIQNQFLYGQIKRIKTQIQRNVSDQVTRVKTEHDEGHKYLLKFRDQKLKRAHQSHQKHKQQLFRSAIDKKVDYQSKIKNKNQIKQTKYKSLPKKMRINFAEQCYPIIGKYPPGISTRVQK